MGQQEYRQQNMGQFQILFLIAQTNLMFNRRATAGRQGYGHMAHQHFTQPASHNKENQPIANNENELTDALTLLTTAANANCSAFATVTSSNQQLTTQLTKAMKCLANLEIKLNEKTGDRDTNTPRYTTPNNKNYCHTHGFIVADKHTSATCNAKAEGHKDAATRTDTKILDAAQQAPHQGFLTGPTAAPRLLGSSNYVSTKVTNLINS
jgi:hypothetical protein